MADNTCVGHYGGLMRWPASPVFALAVSCFFLLMRAYLVYQMSIKPDPARIKEPFYGIINGRFFVSLTGVFIGLNLPVFCIFIAFRDLQGVVPQLQANARQLACYLQDGPNLLVGDYLTILFMLLMLVVMANRRRLLSARLEMAVVSFNSGYLCPAIVDGMPSSAATGAAAAASPAWIPGPPSPSARPFRIGFVQSGSGAWIPPFVQYFTSALASASSSSSSSSPSPPPRIDVVCLDNYGDPSCDYGDDLWLRLNLALEGLPFSADASKELETGAVAASVVASAGNTRNITGPPPTAALTLKVVRSDFFSLDIPTDSIDVFVMPIGPHTHAVANRRGNKKDKQRFLEGLLREVMRTLRPGGRLISSAAKALGSHQAQWEAACDGVGLICEPQAEPEVAPWVAWLPVQLRPCFLPNPLGIGCGKAGWMARPIYWNVFPAYIHVARKPCAAAGEPGDDSLGLSGPGMGRLHVQAQGQGQEGGTAVDIIPSAHAAETSALSQSAKRISPHGGPSRPSSLSAASSIPSDDGRSDGPDSSISARNDNDAPSPIYSGPSQAPAAKESAQDEDIPTAPPMQAGRAPASLADREERDVFPPGLQFRLAELLAVVNVAQWLTLIYLVWAFFGYLQVLPVIPFNKQVCSFMVSLLTTVAPVIYINAEELREEAKTKGLIVPFSVLRNKIIRRWSMHRLHFLLLLAGIAALWLPYFALDAALIVGLGRDTEDVVDVNVYVDIAVAIFFALGAHKGARWYIEALRRHQERSDCEEEEDRRREGVYVHSSERHARPESEVVLSPVCSRSRSGGGGGGGGAQEV